MNRNFVAIDVETANADLASICQIGIARYENGELAEEWKSYVDPEDDFDGWNISIHGIDESMVQGAPTFKILITSIHGFLNGNVSLCHTHFDRTAVHCASKRYGVQAPACVWLDSARVARRAWEQISRRGYGLASICKMLGYEFTHHDALEDAKAAATIFLAAMDNTGLDVDDWLQRVMQPIDPQRSKRDGNPDGPLYGENLVFTGALEIPRREAADIAAELGCRISTSVSKKTTLLVVGDQDIRKLAGHDKSIKHRKAEVLIASGVPIRIVKESDFKAMASLIDRDRSVTN